MLSEVALNRATLPPSAAGNDTPAVLNERISLDHFSRAMLTRGGSHSLYFGFMVRDLAASSWARETGYDVERQLLAPGNRILNVGLESSGGGSPVSDNAVVSGRVAGLNIIGLDPNPVLPSAKVHFMWEDAPIVLGFAQSIPFRDGTFNGVVSVGLFDHWYEHQLCGDGPVYDLAAAEIRRVMKLEGVFLAGLYSYSPHFLEACQRVGFKETRLAEYNYLFTL